MNQSCFLETHLRPETHAQTAPHPGAPGGVQIIKKLEPRDELYQLSGIFRTYSLFSTPTRTTTVQALNALQKEFNRIADLLPAGEPRTELEQLSSTFHNYFDSGEESLAFDSVASSLYRVAHALRIQERALETFKNTNISKDEMDRVVDACRTALDYGLTHKPNRNG